jgi:hypothetical protein
MNQILPGLLANAVAVAAGFEAFKLLANDETNDGN